MPRKPQMSFHFRQHGGLRKGAGRKRHLKNDPKHSVREKIDARTPAHITLKMIDDVPNLRTAKFMRAFAKAVRRTQEFGLRIQHFTIESNHIHLVAEATDNDALTSGLISLKTSIAWALRLIFNFYGRVFCGRYHLRLIRTPTEMRNVLRYVLFNHAHHCQTEIFVDLYSTALEFEELDRLINKRVSASKPFWWGEIKNCLSKAGSWMQAQGWKRADRCSKACPPTQL